MAVSKQDWSLVGIKSIESAGLDAITSEGNGLVVAGPGAGKTELLAQRACFLLQTAACAEPYRILAISFKRDSAKNLQKRVALRCGPVLARRFDSMTFDAFAKGMVDRFRSALPQKAKLQEEYDLRFGLEKRNELRIHLAKCIDEDKSLVETLMVSSAEERFFNEHVIGKRLATLIEEPTTALERLARRFWYQVLRGYPRSQLNFQLIARLAELILISNPMVLRALQSTYKFVFLDEFQDTTGLQYDLTLTAFHGTETILTAVGDPKQRIMVWAGALDGVFATYKTDFQATQYNLVMNYRSAPGLVAIQRHLVSAMDPSAPLPTSDSGKASLMSECQIFRYKTPDREVSHLADIIERTVHEDKVPPNEICILTRNWHDRYTADLIDALGKRSIKARSERQLQDMLAEPFISIVLFCIRLVFSARDADAWLHTVESVFDVSGATANEAQERKVEAQLANFIVKCRESVGPSFDEAAVQTALREIKAFFGEGRLRQAFPQYQRNNYLDELHAQFVPEFSSRLAKSKNWIAAAEDLLGKDAITIMTVHKSKGLEYHTVIFVGLEDSALWGFGAAAQEETCNFFVAFSRAIQRVVFTFCERRQRNLGGPLEQQSMSTIASLYQMLERAGVTATDVA